MASSMGALRLLDISPISATLWKDKADACLVLKRYVEAVEAYESSAEIDPNNPTVWESKADTDMILQNYEEAIDAYDRAIALDKENAAAWQNKGNAYSHLEKSPRISVLTI